MKYSSMTVENPHSTRKDQKYKIVFFAALLVIYIAAFFVTTHIAKQPMKDEDHFWATTQQFSKTPIPSVHLLQHYGELNTPLPFMVFGIVEHIFHAGINGGRFVNLVLSFLIILLISRGVQKPSVHVPVVVGILMFPYYLGCSILLYTDIMAAFFTVAGFIAWRDRRNIMSCFCFILAIASRQYMLAFPAGLLFCEMIDIARATTPALRSQHLRSATAQMIACASIGAWFLFWGAFGPPHEIAKQDILTARTSTVLFDHSLYFLSCMGLYFVIPEFILLKRTMAGWTRHLFRSTLIAAGVIVLFILFPPWQNTDYDIPTMGYMDIISRNLFPDAIRMTRIRD